MTIQQKFKKLIHVQEELFKLEEDLKNKKEELANINKEIQEKKSSLESLKVEENELKNFINSKFKEQCNDYDYEVDISNCYVIELNGKKYIAIRSCKITKSNVYTIATGQFYLNHYFYYDTLNKEDGHYKMFYDYVITTTDTGYSPFGKESAGLNHTYEEHILKVFPELCIFLDQKVPNTYLKKLYYELNDLGSKKYIKEKNF